MLIYIFLEISFVVGKYDVMLFFYFFYFGEIRPYALKPKTFFFIYLFFDEKNGYFNTGFVSLRYKNTNQY